ncbi:glycosyl transferase, partial [Brachyspira hyodysenteriae]|uniref:ATP-grasp fold amidoligase family protein n=1 Tax=Brachyspira hyodysenteriae TaxID=159 RepID=UPI00063D9F46
MTPKENIDFRKEIIRKKFLEYVGYEPNLDNPQTFNEKLQWLKLYYHDPLMTKCADKYAVREYIKETVGEEYLIPLIGVWNRVEDIDFNSLPNQFVLKVNWGSGMNIIVKDKNNLDIEDAKNKLSQWMKPSSNHYYTSYEWGYKYIKPKIICEKYMKDDNTNNLIVYGFYCFNGIPKFIHTITDAHTGTDRCNIYDLNWNKQNFFYIWKNTDYDIDKPKQLELMISLVKKLCFKFVHVRVDLFHINGAIYIGELTFYTNAGLSNFSPIEWDYKFGELLELPKEKKLEYDFIDKDTLLNQVTNLEPIVKELRDLEEKNIYLKEQQKKLNKLIENHSLFNLFSIF